MHVAASLTELYRTANTREIVAAIGVFDGVHRGHQRILATLVALARRIGATPVVVTFEPHPRAVLLSPDAAPKRLTSREQQLRHLEHFGVEALVLLPFTRELAGLSADSFLDRYLLVGPGKLRGICVGSTWRFGAGGSGDTAFLARAGTVYGFEAVSVPEFLWYRRPVSSTRIRQALISGRLGTARRMLGRPYVLWGNVVRGLALGGAEFHCPTANIACSEMQLPRSGVYAARGRLMSDDNAPAAQPRDGILYVGTAPTVRRNSPPDAAPRVEFHFFDLEPGPLYGQTIEVEPVARMRSDRCFPSRAALREQIHHDIQDARQVLERARRVEAR